MGQMSCADNFDTLEHMISHLKNILPRPIGQQESHLLDKLTRYPTDFEYLRDEMSVLEDRANDLTKSIEKHVGFRQSRRTALLTILAGIYIPLSFVTVRLLIRMLPMVADTSISPCSE